jgi:hypothetical protein
LKEGDLFIITTIITTITITTTITTITTIMTRLRNLFSVKVSQKYP